MTIKFIILGLLLMSQVRIAASQDNITYAEKLGYPKGSKVVIFHVDDAGMSYESNQGAKISIENGIATSCSIMMTCPWSADMAKYSIAHPEMDAGLHLVLTSEWKAYRWGPLSGSKQVPGLVDQEGNLWSSVEEVVKNASPDEVEMEIRAQIERALSIGLKPTHLDSHMGTLFASDQFLEKYIKVGLDYNIPVMFPGGNNKLLAISQNLPLVNKLKAEGKYEEGMELPRPENLKKTGEVGKMIWDAGLPVLDDLHTISGSWKPEKGEASDEEWGKHKAEQCKELLRQMEPGLAIIIVHSSEKTETFQYISGSGGSRYADMLAMTDPGLQQFIEKEGIILTTWREVMERRQQVK
ncbi:MAG: polysaccharide deacetylase family protein [Anditalea sp.]